MHKKYCRQFSLQSLLILLLLGLANGFEPPREAQTADIDNLRLSIQATQGSLIQLQSNQSQLQRKFQQVNARIYHYKQASTSSNPIKNYRLQNALKASRKMADQIENNARQIKLIEKKLQHLYQTAIQQIDREIQNNLASSQNAFDQKKSGSIGFKAIQKLEDRKSVV